jgi:hypothetical protein
VQLYHRNTTRLNDHQKLVINSPTSHSNINTVSTCCIQNIRLVSSGTISYAHKYVHISVCICWNFITHIVLVCAWLNEIFCFCFICLVYIWMPNEVFQTGNTRLLVSCKISFDLCWMCILNSIWFIHIYCADGGWKIKFKENSRFVRMENCWNFCAWKWEKKERNKKFAHVLRVDHGYQRG